MDPEPHLKPDKKWFQLSGNDGKLKVERGTDLDDDDMQFEINKIVKWCETWSMEISLEKCKVMHLRKQIKP